MMEREEKVLPSESRLEPLAVEIIAKITNVTNGPNIFGIYAASISF